MMSEVEARCPLCGKVTVAGLGAHPDFSGARIYACGECEFWFGSPAPSAAELQRYYETTYRQRRTWSTSREYLTLMRRRGVAQCRFIAPTQANIRTAVDIGCGVGALVLALTEAGVDAVGFDSDESVIRIGRERLRAKVHTDYVSTADARTTEPQDLLCLSHVVEHFADPVLELRQLSGRVRAGGYIFVEVPNCTSGMFQQGVETESHLGFFTPRSLQQLATRLALEVVKLEECGPVIEDYYRAKAVRRAQESARAGQGPLAKLIRLPAKIIRRLLPARTEFDGTFSTPRVGRDEPRLWLRALFRVPQKREHPAA
jgi:2-polyprenyl-3-methyl-5-hydroxy-6-metoxy-1,4-benzoquinol methylase